MSGKSKTLRFAVGSTRATRSTAWKIWVQGEEFYLLSYGASLGHEKFSFHKSGVCRWALIRQGGSGKEREIREWLRDPLPPVGAGQGVCVMSLTFPANHLSHWSIFGATDDVAIKWIDGAGANMATHLKIIISNESDEFIFRNCSGGEGRRRVEWLTSLRSGIKLFILSSIVECGDVDLYVPGDGKNIASSEIRALNFPNWDMTASGRPLRLMVLGNPEPPDLWELGGYVVQ